MWGLLFGEHEKSQEEQDALLEQEQEDIERQAWPLAQHDLHQLQKKNNDYGGITTSTNGEIDYTENNGNNNDHLASPTSVLDDSDKMKSEGYNGTNHQKVNNNKNCNQQFVSPMYDIADNEMCQHQQQLQQHDEQQQQEFQSPTTASPTTTQTADLAALHNRRVRFQVVIWHVGPIDAVLSLVTMKFRITIWWEAPSDAEHQAMAVSGYGNYDATNTKVWQMEGRQRAFQKELTSILPGSNLLYVPPVSVLNAAADLTIVGEPEVCCIDKHDTTTVDDDHNHHHSSSSHSQSHCSSERRRMKWTCMYHASLIQDHMCVKAFPHDEHDLVLRLGILKHRQAGRRWDKSVWRIGLATERDSCQTIRIPHGLVVDHVKIPEFHPHLDFAVQVIDSPFDGQCHLQQQELMQDECLQVSIHCRRDSGYYDNNILPLLAFLNVAGIVTLVLEPSEFGSRGEILTSIAFVSIGIRLSVDSKLPNVGYQIKMQAILNHFFYTLLFLHVESAVVYYLTTRCHWDPSDTDPINNAVILLTTLYTLGLLTLYYIAAWRYGTGKS